MVVVFGYVALPKAVEGDAAMAIVYAVIVLTSVGDFMLNPATRPKNIARSLEASRRVVASGG